MKWDSRGLGLLFTIQVKLLRPEILKATGLRTRFTRSHRAIFTLKLETP
jgi:hypothetical protein